MNKVLFRLSATTAFALFFSTVANAQNTSPFWSLAGNSNANINSKLGTTNSVPLNLVTGNATRIRIAIDGKTGIGTTNPQQRLHIEGASNQAIFVNTSALGPVSGSGQIGYVKALPTAAGNRLGYFLVGSRGGAEANYNAAGMVGYAADAWTAGSSHPAYLAFETTPAGSNARLERVRISENGNVSIGAGLSPAIRLLVTDNITSEPTAVIQNLSNNPNYADGLYVQAGSDDASTVTPSWFIAFLKPDGTSIGSVSQADANSVAYNTASDKRLKANIRESKFGLADINKIQVRDYEFAISNTSQTGFLAQQLYEVYPQAVTVGGSDAKKRPWMVDYGRITPLLVKAVQELSQKTDEIEALKNELADLKQQVSKLINTNNISANTGSLGQSVPNPANGITRIGYAIPSGSRNAKLLITDNAGRTVRTIQLAGNGTVDMETASLSSGIYNYSLIVDGKKIETKRLTVVK